MGVKFSNTNPAAPGGDALVIFQKDPLTGEVSAAYTPGGSTILLQTDGVDNGDQAKLDLVAGTGITLTDDGVGGVTIDSTPGTTLLLQTDGVDNGDQTKLDLIAGTNVTLTDNGVGGVTINAASSGGTVTHTGTLSSGQLIKGNGGADIAVGDLSGDVTTSGSLVTTAVNLPDGVTQAGKLVATNIAAPATPASGKTNVYVDSTNKVLSSKNDAGAVSNTVVPDTGSANNFLTAISAAGVISKAQPTFSNLAVAAGDVSFSTAAAYKLTNVHDPASAQDAATKNYVDTNAPSIKTKVDLTAQSASIGSTNLLASAPAGLYRVSYYLNVTQAATTSSSILLTLGWTDGSTTVQSFATPTIIKNTVGYFISDSIVIESGAAVNITYATTYASVGATALNYSLRVHLELI